MTTAATFHSVLRCSLLIVIGVITQATSGDACAEDTAKELELKAKQAIGELIKRVNNDSKEALGAELRIAETEARREAAAALERVIDDLKHGLTKTVERPGDIGQFSREGLGLMLMEAMTFDSEELSVLIDNLGVTPPEPGRAGRVFDWHRYFAPLKKPNVAQKLLQHYLRAKEKDVKDSEIRAASEILVSHFSFPDVALAYLKIVKMNEHYKTNPGNIDRIEMNIKKFLP